MSDQEHNQPDPGGPDKPADPVEDKPVALSSVEDKLADAVEQGLVDSFNQSVTLYNRAPRRNRRPRKHPLLLGFDGQPIDAPVKPKDKPQDIVKAWGNYIGTEQLEDWQRLARDLHLKGEYKTLKECKEAFFPVWVNLVDFLKFDPEDAALFRSEIDLRIYCRYTRKFFPMDIIKADRNSPLKALLAYVLGIRPGTADDKILRELLEGTFVPWPIGHEHYIVETYEFAGKDGEDKDN